MRNLNTKLNENSQNIALLNLRPPVSQLAKSHFPTVKALPVKEKPVGSNTEKKAHTHPRRGTHTYTHEKTKISANYLLKISDLVYPNVTVVLGNQHYVEAISDAYNPYHTDLFLRLVQTFTILRKSNRLQPVEGVFESSEEDFLSALRVMRCRTELLEQQRTSKPVKTFGNEQAGEQAAKKVLNYLQTNFPTAVFTSVLLAKHLEISRSYLSNILSYLAKANYLEKLPQTQFNAFVYRLKKQQNN